MKIVFFYYYYLISSTSIYFTMNLVSGGCNEAVCSSIVSKCLLIKSCMCTQSNYTCHKDCFVCLETYHSECCSCLDFCYDHSNATPNSGLNKQSYVETFSDTVPGLFKALTEFTDELNRWTSLTFPINLNVINPNAVAATDGVESADIGSRSISTNGLLTLDCTVVFMQQCMNWMKCKKNCQTMGATSYRWFHDGCCECVGENCVYYGIEESRCKRCSDAKQKNSSEKRVEIDDFIDYDDDYDNIEDGEDYY